ncbi:MAG: O-antigen ligase C-terminal domain-containing protein [Proteobacteria bacterium]|nr:O-antigen ligase C-terminal domain-containing protein [Pseudomonadota bacterium]
MSSARAPTATQLWPIPACAAVALAPLIAYNVSPSSTFFNQAAALIGWGAWLVWLASALPRDRAEQPSPGLSALLAALGCLLLAAVASPFWTHLPWSLALSSISLIAIAALVAWSGAALSTANLGPAAFRAFCFALIVAGILSSLIGAIQVFFPQWTDGTWIAHSVLEGRAVGNLRQPNHLSSLLLWAIIAAVWLGEVKAIDKVGTGVLSVVFMFVTVLSASRTGAVGAVLLGVWGLIDRRLSKRGRRLLIAMPLVYLAFWWGTSLWADSTHHVFGGETRFSGSGDVSSSRFGIWSNTLSLIRMHPWLGVGFGEFNFAWSMTPFPGRPVAFFDHTHNLLLQFAVELGLPLAFVVTALLLYAFVMAFKSALRGEGDAGTAPLERSAFAMVLMIGVHSQLEYPLWYAYFLLPTAFAFGLCLGRRPAAERVAASGAPGGSCFMLGGGLAVVLGALFALTDYQRVVVIFEPPPDAAPLLQRIQSGSHSVFFSHHADYAAATTLPHPGQALWAFAGATHYLLDARLMMAWARALEESGDTQRARYVAQRLKEFRNDQAEEFFDPCTEPPEPDQPFQCQEPTQALTYEDMR